MFKTFPYGGIHPPETKLTSKNPVQYLPVPELVTIPLSQHIGAPATAVVNKGDYVRTGQLIAATTDSYRPISIPLFQAGSARIDSITDTSGYRQQAIFIDVEGDEWMDDIDRSTMSHGK